MKTTPNTNKIYILLFVISMCFSLKAQQSMQVSPSKFIAYSLYNFSKFIDWPTEYSQNTFHICVVGDKSVYTELLKLAENKRQGNATYEITYLKSPEEIQGYHHIIYFSNMYSGKVKNFISNPSSKGTLLVTEREGMTKLGSFISFIIDDNGQMGFEIAKTNAEKNSLSIQKQLERLATRVI